MEREIDERVVVPLLAAMKSRGAPFRGVLFVGLMIVEGRPQVLEFNVRFGDPETEVLMARWDGDVLPLLLGAANGELSGVTPKWAAPAALSVVMAAAGYPGSPKKGDVITGLAEANRVEGAVVFHAGTKREGEAVKTNGGRVLAVTAVGGSVDEAAERAYRAVSAVKWEGAQYRKDIGWQARRR
jgi:phosphoribosylamine--glycine ligase